jgi:hypothetical protein
LLADQLRKAWRVREASSLIHAVLKFEAEGLVLGAGTILAEPGADLTPGGAGETRLTTLLAAAYGRRMTKDVVGHIRSANTRWREADQRLADLHLALTRLERLPQPQEAARRLFMADGLMRAGAEPLSILKALDIDGPASAPMAKYSADQLRAPAGNGVFSGRWVREAEAAAAAAASAIRSNVAGALRSGAARAATQVATRLAGVLADLSVADLAALALVAETVVGVGVVGGVLFYPGNAKLAQDGDVPGYPGVKYHWNPDELGGLRITSTNADGSTHTSVALPAPGGVFVDDKGRVVGRRLPDGRIAFALASLSLALATTANKPNYCPKPTDERASLNPRDLDYEDFVKKIVNDPPTPRGLGVGLLNPQANGALVVFDDCQRETGVMIEAKRGYGELIANVGKWAKLNFVDDWLDQSLRQVQAAKGRPIRWYFSDPISAAFAKALFNTARNGREKIDIETLPFPG